jgi:hypothetical protein
MQELNLPLFNIRINKLSDKLMVFDPIRKKSVKLTPEEWVRQHFINYLINHLGYPKSLVKVEFNIKYNQLIKRPDILVFDNDGSPLIIIECKSTKIKLNQEVLEQVTIYNKTVQAKYCIVTNGLKHIFWTHNDSNGSTNFINSIPIYNET